MALYFSLKPASVSAPVRHIQIIFRYDEESAQFFIFIKVKRRTWEVDDSNFSNMKIFCFSLLYICMKWICLGLGPPTFVVRQRWEFYFDVFLDLKTNRLIKNIIIYRSHTHTPKNINFAGIILMPGHAYVEGLSDFTVSMTSFATPSMPPSV